MSFWRHSVRLLLHEVILELFGALVTDVYMAMYLVLFAVGKQNIKAHGPLAILCIS